MASLEEETTNLLKKIVDVQEEQSGLIEKLFEGHQHVTANIRSEIKEIVEIVGSLVTSSKEHVELQKTITQKLLALEKTTINQASLQREFKQHRKAIVGDMVAAIRAQITQKKERDKDKNSS